ncbi:MAG: hypothetical protein KJP02_10885 [Octadecabacter sp.]|nr:hypothetical protein [Octadecabacter sp.]
MSRVIVSSFTKARKLKSFRQILERDCPHDVDDLAFVQQSHNSTVFRGTLGGQTAFFKAYDLPDADALMQRGVAEIEAVSRRMKGFAGGVAPLLWASMPNGIVATGAVSGVAVSEALEHAGQGCVLEKVYEWLHAYAGDTAFDDRFSTSYWMQKRQTADLDKWRGPDRQVASALRELQARRADKMGTVPAVKGQVPKDFAPWNLHWDGEAVWGFDMEGHVVAPLARKMARFRVLAVEQSASGSLFTSESAMNPVASNAPFSASGARAAKGSDPADLMAFMVGDMLFERFEKWADHRVIGPRLRLAIEAHLSDG